MNENDILSMYTALWAIANMQITESTNKHEILALCISIARIEIERISSQQSIMAQLTERLRQKGKTHDEQL